MTILDCCKQPHWLGSQHQSRRELSIVSSQHPVRSPSPNCQCSCHYRIPPEHIISLQTATTPTRVDQSHIYSTVRKKTSPKRNDNLLPSKKSPYKFGLKSVPVLSNVKRRVLSSRESSSNYCDITELYESPSDKAHRTSSFSTASDHYYPLLRPVNFVKPKNILFLVCINPFKFTTMDPLQVDSRLIVFSLLDSFTKLSPNKIFENFIKKLKDEGKKSITVFNLSEPIEHMRNNLNTPVCEYGFAEKHSPSLELLCSLCKAIDSWLALDSTRNVAVIYSKRDLSRSALAIAVFLQYVKICLNEESAFDFESMQTYFQYNLQQYLQPCQKRYIEYFKGLLSGESRINSQQFYLNCVIIQKLPHFDCKPFIKIYQGMSLIYCSPILNLNESYKSKNDLIVFSLNPPLKLRGDILLKCYHKQSNPSARAAMFSLQFHTGTLSDDVAIFPMDQLDIAPYDKRYHPDTQVELMFNDTNLDSVPDVECVEDDQITKWNSYENFFTDDSSLEYTKGPLDGSLYATVSKRSPTQTPTATSSSKPVTDEKKLDELLDEIFLEIESFPDITADGKCKDVSPFERQPSPKLMGLSLEAAHSPSTHSDTSGPVADTSPFNDSIDYSDSQLTWLQKQQLKLKSKQGQSLQKRNFMEKQLIEELKHTIKSHNSDEVDGITAAPQTPVVPVRTSSRIIMPLFAEQSDLGQPVRTLSLDRSDSIISNGSHYQSLTQYSTMPISPLRVTTSYKVNGNNETPEYQVSQHYVNEASLSPVRRPITPSFPVKEHRHSMLHSPIFDNPSSGNVPLFIKDTSPFWYKPHISREDTIKLLHDKPSGTFIIRDSHSFQGAYGLALKIATTDDHNVSDSVRHFLIESTNKGVQIKGCQEEPIFSSLAALVSQHSITRISLPTTLVIPSVDIEAEENGSQLLRIYENGAACNVIYFVCEDVESLTGLAAIRRVVDNLLQLKASQIKPTVVHFKASNQGITLTDNAHRIFFRQHYPMPTVSHCSMDPENRSLVYQHEGTRIESVLFGFVARKKGSTTDNECLIFGQFESDQPSHAIVDFVNKLKSL